MRSEREQDDAAATVARPALAVTIVALAAILTVALCASTVAAAQETEGDGESETPETADEYFETFRTMEGTAAYEEYEEFETIRTFAVSRTQEIGTLSADEEAELAAVLETMRAFDRAYTRAENGDFEASLAAAEEANTAIERLEEHEETQATLADLALTRFYERLGDGLRADAEATDRTPDRIEYLRMTATAYERANMPDEAAEFNLRVEQQTAAYEASLERIDDAESEASAFLADCVDCSGIQPAVLGATNALETFDRYRQSQQVDAAIADARAEAERHGLEERAASLAETGDETGTAKLSLAVASVTVLLAYGVIVGLLGTIVLGRIFAWQRTYDRAQVGSVVSVGDSDV